MTRLSLAAGSVLDAAADEVVRAAAGAGFDAVGLRLSDHHALDVSRRADLRRLATDLGVDIHDAEVHRIGAAAADVDPLLDAAAELGAEFVLVVSDLPDLGATCDALADVVARAAARGLRVGLEYMAWTTPTAPAAAVDLAADTGAWVVVDLLHHHRVGAGPAELAAVVGSGRLGWVQLADAPAAAPADLVHEARHARFPPGEGDLPLHDLLARLPGDEVTVSVEVQSDELSGRLGAGDRARHLAAMARRVLDGVDERG